MSEVHVVLYLLALLMLYALAAKLDEAAEMPTDRVAATSVHARCVTHAPHGDTEPATAASASNPTARTARAAC